MENVPNSEFVDELPSQLESLRKRVLELETENAKFSALLSNCRCRKMEESSSAHDLDSGHLVKVTENLKLDGNDVMTVNPSKQILPGSSTKTLHHFPKRYVALKVMYFGQRFYGFASEAQMDPTIESEIFKALHKTRLVSGDKKEFQYSRCGRTDKGVSSVGQVISLFLRTNCKETAVSNGYSGEHFAKELCEEIDYVKMLNRVLPEDIRIIGWSPAPTDFSARFSCLSRQYKYFFWRENLNITAMEIAGKKFIGEHDFRNFCKMDAANVHNYKRHITSFEILPCDERFLGDQLWVVQIKGSAFLWHQIRCMVAVLFFIGQGLESPNVIDVLVDIERTPRKPQYKMAPEIPLVLQSCEFEGLKFSCSSEARQALQAHLEKECRSYKLHAAIFHEALQCLCIKTDESWPNRITKKKESSHIPLMLRATEPSYEERCTKLTTGSGRRKGNYGAPHA
ncbi:Pseudouridine synthase family protein [Forsythia ovata]|uniref:Pseudouridine synthase family protein n=1 Tax=Forsythia ovata TaxID=205694 RepID=A0ABD1RLQ6_9LAMI